MADQERTVGQTRDTGFQIGVRRTLPMAREAAWRLLTTPSGVKIWLGEVEGQFVQGATYRLADSTTGEVTVFAINSHLRTTWLPPGWQRPSIIQVRVLPHGGHTSVAFHQEWLPGPQEREQRRVWFTDALSQLKKLV